MPSRDLSAFLDDDSLKYEGIPSSKHPNGKTYTVKSPDAKTGLHLASIGEMGLAQGSSAPVLDDNAERGIVQMVLGDALPEMIDDGVSWGVVQEISKDAFLYWSVNPEFADLVLESRGKAVEVANRATKRAAAKAAKKPAKKAATKTAKGTAKSTAG